MEVERVKINEVEWKKGIETKCETNVGMFVLVQLRLGSDPQGPEGAEGRCHRITDDCRSLEPSDSQRTKSRCNKMTLSLLS